MRRESKFRKTGDFLNPGTSWKNYPYPETNRYSSPLKIDGWKTIGRWIVLFETRPIFQGLLTVSFREHIWFSYDLYASMENSPWWATGMVPGIFQVGRTREDTRKKQDDPLGIHRVDMAVIFFGGGGGQPFLCLAIYTIQSIKPRILSTSTYEMWSEMIGNKKHLFVNGLCFGVTRAGFGIIILLTM